MEVMVPEDGNTYLDDFLKLDLSTFTFSTIDTTTKPGFKICYYGGSSGSKYGNNKMYLFKVLCREHEKREWNLYFNG